MMQHINKYIIALIALSVTFPISAQKQYLHIFDKNHKSYVLSSIDSILFDETTTGRYMNLYHHGIKYCVSNIAEIDSFSIGDTITQRQIIDLNEIDIFPNMDYTEMVAVEGGDAIIEVEDFPDYQVTLKSFYIGKYEVTQQLWEYVMSYAGTAADGSTMSPNSSIYLGPSSPSSSLGLGDYFPVYYVSYYDIVDIFIPRLNKITGKTFRLPTEAEWQYAASGGNKSQNYIYSGSNIIDEVAWHQDNSSGTTHMVGLKKPNELGIYDMSGNLYEECSDWYSSADVGTHNVGRGGSYNHYLKYHRVTYRNGGSATTRGNLRGFRLVCTY